MASHANTACLILGKDFITEAPGFRSVYLGFERQAPGHTSPHIVYPRWHFEPILHPSPDNCVARSTMLSLSHSQLSYLTAFFADVILAEKKAEQGYYSFIFLYLFLLKSNLKFIFQFCFSRF